MAIFKNNSDRQAEIDDLRAQLAEAHEVLNAIRGGQVDALVVDSPEGARVFTVAGAERPYRVFIEQMGEGAASLTPDGTVLFSNRQFANLLQVPADVTAGRNFCDFLSAQDAARFRTLVAVPSGQPKRTELVLRRRSGVNLPAYLSASIFEEGGIRTVCIIVSDQTEQKRAEEQVRQAHKMEALGQLTAGIAHDFNNLLMAILGNLNVLGRRLNDDDILVRVSRAEQAVLRGAKLVQQLLAFARKQHLSLEAIKVNQIVANALDLIEGTVGSSIEMMTLLRPGLWDASADATQVEMMLVNLALNARDAMPHGGRLRIETQNVTVPADTTAPSDLDRGRYVRVTVADNGTGMTEETRAKAIEPFYTTKPPGSGSGLGLSQVYGLAKQFGGSLLIESQLGQGTAVHFYLPRAGEAFAREDAGPSGCRTPNAKMELILVVDDDPDVRSLISDLIGLLGYRTMTADNARAALDIILGNDDVDLLISDVVMPGMNGFQLSEQVRNTRPDLPILLMSGYADHAGLNAGSLALPLIEKPFQLDDIEPVVDRLLQERHGQRPRVSGRAGEPP